MAYQRLLVIANETIAGKGLHNHIRELTADGGRVIIIAPALSSRLKYVFSDVDEPRAEAQERLPDPHRGGRPKTRFDKPREVTVGLANGISMERVLHEDGYSIRLRGAVVDVEMIELLMADIRNSLSRRFNWSDV